MEKPLPSSPTAGSKAPSGGEFIAIVALMMGLTAFSIDNLLPAFAPIRTHFAVSNANNVQFLISAYLFGFGALQLVYGTISDVVGRKKALMAGLLIYAFGCVLAMMAESFTVLLVARIIQGMGAAAARVLSVAIVRDRFAGRDMARVMSYAMMVFLVIPVIAPTIGAGILLVGEWHSIFASMLLLCLILAVWFGMRMPETLHPEYRVAFSVKGIGAGIVTTVSNRRAMGYTCATALMLGCLMAYVGTAQQIFETEIYHLGAYFPLAFAAVAAVMSAASFLNASLVRRVGMRRLSHFGVCGFTAVGLVQVLVALQFDGRPPVLLFCALLSLNQALFALSVANFNSIAMEPLGAVAGTASSFIGFFTTLAGALIGMLVGQTFNGTVLPLGLGYLVLGALSILMVLWAEHGRLFSSKAGAAH